MMFDFNRDGKLGFGEVMSAAGIIGAFADEMMQDSGEPDESDRKSSSSSWYDEDSDDNDRDDDDDFDSDDDEDWDGIGKVDASDIGEVMDAVESGQYDWDDIEQLVEDALDNGVEFDESDVEEICAHIFDHDLKSRLWASI